MADGSGDVVARAVIPIEADTSAFDRAFASLSNRAQQQIRETVDKIQDQMAGKKVEIGRLEKLAPSPENLSKINKLQKELDKLQAKMEAVQSRTVARAEAAAKDAAEKKIAQDKRAAERKEAADKRASDRKIEQDAREAKSSEAKAARQEAADRKREARERMRVAAQANRTAGGDDDDGHSGGRRGRGRGKGEDEKSRRSRGLGQAGIELSRLFEDVAVAGPLGGVNNVPGLLESIGRAAGMSSAALAKLTAVGGGLATVGFLVYQNWDRIKTAFAGPVFQTAAEQLEELRKKANLTAAEFDRLAREDSLKNRVDELRGVQPEKVQKREEIARQAVGEAGIGNFVQGLLRVAPEAVDSQGEAGAAIGERDRLQKEVDRLKKLAATPGMGAGVFQQLGEAEAKLKAAKDAVRPAREATAAKMAAAGTLPQFYGPALKNLVGEYKLDPTTGYGKFEGGVIERDPGAFAGGDRQAGLRMLEGLRLSTPEGQRDAEDRAGDEFEQNFEQQFKANLETHEREQAEARQRETAGKFSGGIIERFRPEILGDIRNTGKIPDDAAAQSFQPTIAAALEGMVPAEDIEGVARQIAKTLVDTVAGEVAQRAGQDRTDLRTAAIDEAKDDEVRRRNDEIQRRQKERDAPFVRAQQDAQLNALRPPEPPGVAVASRFKGGRRQRIAELQARKLERDRAALANRTTRAKNAIANRGKTGPEVAGGGNVAAPRVDPKIAAAGLTVAAPPSAPGDKDELSKLVEMTGKQLDNMKQEAQDRKTTNELLARITNGVPARVGGHR